MEGILREVTSPIGAITIGAIDQGLALCATGSCTEDLLGELSKRDITFRSILENEVDSPALRTLQTAARALELFFSGEFSALQSVPLVLNGTEFQVHVWRELQNVRAGELATYGAIAESINNPGAVRAVGLGCRVNPLHLFIPCHRIVSADGALTGFRGGIEVKDWLINFEQAISKEEGISAAA